MNQETKKIDFFKEMDYGMVVQLPKLPAVFGSSFIYWPVKYDSVTGNAPIIKVREEKQQVESRNLELHKDDGDSLAGEIKVEIVSFERGEIDFGETGYQKLVGIGEGYLIEELSFRNTKSKILRCEFDNKMR